ncbi:MAG: oxidoreductase [Solirubrobacteraceae bacterium]
MSDRPHDDARSEDRVWLITGTSTGFGRALAESVLDHGGRLVATARDPDVLRDLERRAPERARAMELDVTDRERAREVVREAVGAFGRIDVVVNNAGVGLLGALEELSEAQLRGQFETNVFGVLNMTRAALPQLRRQRSGHFVQMSSVGGVHANPGHSIYAATKFALEGFSEGLAKEVAHLGIRVTIVEPGPFRTDFAGRSMTIAEPIDDYAEIMRSMHDRFRAMDGTQAGDPALAAAAIITAVEHEDPPLRLALGKHALSTIRSQLEARLRDLDTWEALGSRTDFT